MIESLLQTLMCRNYTKKIVIIVFSQKYSLLECVIVVNGNDVSVMGNMPYS